MRRRPIPRTTVRLHLEALEGRDVPAAVNWTLGANGDFADPAAWTDASNHTHHVPRLTDDAVIPGQYSVTSSANETVNSLSATNFQIAAGTFTINSAARASTLPGLKVAPGATFSLPSASNGGEVDLYDGSIVSGTVFVGAGGVLRFRRGNITVSNATLTGPGLYLVQGNSLGGPNVTLATNLTAPANLSLTNGQVLGPGTLTVPTGVTTDWVTTQYNGASVAALAAVQPGGTLVIGGLHDEQLNATLTNAGTIVYQQAIGPNSSGFALGASGRLDNLAGATFRIQTAVAITGSPQLTSVINNAGTITKQTAAGTTAVNNVTVNNSGLVGVQAGTLNLGGGGGMHTGRFTIAAGAGLTFTGGARIPVVLNAGASVSGPGLLTFAGGGAATQVNAGATIDPNTRVSLTGGTLKLNTPVTLTSYNQSGGALDGAATLTLSGAALWTGGTMQGGGTTAVAAGATLALSGTATKSLSPRTLDVFGTVNHTGAGPLGFTASGGAALTVRRGGVYNLTGDANFAGATGVITNRGLFVKSSPTAAGTSSINHDFNNTGTVRVDSGTLQLQRPFTQTAGRTTVAAGATLQFASPAQIKGGTLDGFGIVVGNVTSTGTGTVSPGGASPGSLAVTGSVTLGGPFVADLTGAASDRLKVNGAVTLGGALTINPTAAPTVGTVITLIDNDGTDAVSGTFAGLPQNAVVTVGGTRYRISYAGGTGNDVTLTVVP
jgi:hypothetical protein